MHRRLLHNRSFVCLWIGQAISATGDYFTLLAIPIFVNRLTGSILSVGLAFIATTLPALLLGPVAGVFVDRFDRRKVMIVSDILRGGLTLCLLTIHDAHQVWVVYLVGFLISCGAQFFFPARGAVLPLIVPDPADWLGANATLRIIQTVGMLAGPALAGVSIGLWGERVAFLADGASFLLSAAAISFMRVPRTTDGKRPGGSSLRTVWNDLQEGLAFLRGSPAALGVLVCMGLASVGFATVNMLWIPYLQRRFGIGASGLGLADTALGLGMLASGLLIGQIARRARKPVLGAGSLALNGLMYIAIIWMPAFTWIVIWQFLGGLLVTPMHSAMDTITQEAVPDLKRGRVASTMNAVNNGAGMLAMAGASLFGEVIGLESVFVIVGLVVLAAGLLGFWLLREPPEPVVERPPAAGDR